MQPGPTESDAIEIAANVLRRPVLRASRIPTCEGNFAFDVTMGDGDRIVVRATWPDGVAGLRGAAHWSATLRPVGIPLPSLLNADLDMRSFPFPFLLLERFPGTDLGDVYTTLSAAEKRALATVLAGHQQRVGQLPPGRGYGYTLGYDGRFPHATWPDAVAAMLGRSRRRVTAYGAVDPIHIERVAQAMIPFVPDLAKVPPTPFLHDATTKNVIVHQGRLRGIVDVDDLCFGDPLLTVALTRMALLARGWPTDYIAFWRDAMGPSAGGDRLLDLYTAVFAVDFLSEVDHHFANRPHANAVDPGYVARLLAILDELLGRLTP